MASRWVLLHHDLPDGSHHLDLLLAIDDTADPQQRPDDHVLLAFRLAERLTDDLGSADVVRTPDHRAFYLEHEGPVSGGRGDVRRIAAGRWTPRRILPESVDGAIETPAGPRAIRLRRLGATDTWRLDLSLPVPG